MKEKLQQHNIEGVFVLILFAIFAMAVVVVLALGANSYQSLVKRDNESYNRRIITSFVAAKIRNHDMKDAVAVGGFAKKEQDDGISTLHLFKEIEGEIYDVRIYYYDGYIRELFTLADLEISPEAGNKIIPAKELKMSEINGMICIQAQDENGIKGETSIYPRCRQGVSE